MKFSPKICEHCGNTTEYEDNIDKGKTIALIKVYNFIQKKGINAVNPKKEMANMSEAERNNVKKLQHWGLIVALEEVGCYAITSKAIAFLKGEIRVPKTMIIEKNGKKELGSYPFNPEKTVSAQELLSKTNPFYWEGDFIKPGVVVK